MLIGIDNFYRDFKGLLLDLYRAYLMFDGVGYIGTTDSVDVSFEDECKYQPFKDN